MSITSIRPTVLTAETRSRSRGHGRDRRITAAVACPFCRAPVGVACPSFNGHPHAERSRAWKHAGSPDIKSAISISPITTGSHPIPIDRLAARVTRAASHWDQFGPEWRSPSPCPIRHCPLDLPDLSGSTVGRLTVIGLAESVRQGKNAQWLCLCACGYYCLRRTHAINGYINADGNEMSAACSKCGREAKCLKADYFAQHGRYPDEVWPWKLPTKIIARARLNRGPWRT